jgi:hypothetical protein
MHRRQRIRSAPAAIKAERHPAMSGLAIQPVHGRRCACAACAAARFAKRS